MKNKTKYNKTPKDVALAVFAFDYCLDLQDGLALEP